MSKWKIIGKEKVGNKVAYKCQNEVTNETRDFSKDDIIEQKSNISNVYIQNYKGQKIIRIKGNDHTSSKSSSSSSSTHSSNNSRKPRNKILLLDLYKNLCKEFGIRSMEEALAIGFDLYDFETELDTRHLQDYTRAQYKLASTIKRIADKENNDLLIKYRDCYNKAQE